MGPLTRKAFEAMDHQDMKRSVQEAAHFHITPSMWDRLFELIMTLPEPISFEGCCPASDVVIEVDGYASFLVNDYGDNRVVVTALVSEPINCPMNTVLGAYYKRSDKFSFSTTIGSPSHENDFTPVQREVMTAMTMIDLLFSLMAEPRFVKQTPVSNTRRQMAAKKIGQKALRYTWVKLGWTLGSTTIAKATIPGSAPQKAFHMVRAHWRFYDHQTPRSERRPHRPGWWVWVESYYSGNPALGEVKHHYKPNLDDPGKSSAMMNEVISSKIALAVDQKPKPR